MIVEAFPDDYDVMLKIASCESGIRHFGASGVIKSHTNDSGVFQINSIWIPTAEKMGLDIMKPEDNIKMAVHIKEVQGLKAWVCYNKMLASAG